ncbi:MAG: GNAT family N-acetyltransferase [Phycisphaerales bacterium]
MPAPSITRATLDDAPLIAPLFAAYREFYKKPDGDSVRCEVFLRERISKSESVIFVARHAGVVAGFTQLYPIFTSVGLARVWHLNDLFVAPNQRRHGVAKALMLHAIAFAKQDGAARLTLETQVGNAAARSLYERMGMTIGTEFVKYALTFD